MTITAFRENRPTLGLSSRGSDHPQLPELRLGLRSGLRGTLIRRVEPNGFGKHRLLPIDHVDGVANQALSKRAPRGRLWTRLGLAEHAANRFPVGLYPLLRVGRRKSQIRRRNVALRRDGVRCLDTNGSLENVFRLAGLEQTLAGQPVAASKARSTSATLPSEFFPMRMRTCGSQFAFGGYASGDRAEKTPFAKSPQLRRRSLAIHATMAFAIVGEPRKARKSERSRLTA